MNEEKNIYPRQIARFLDAQDIEGLTGALRQADDVPLRASAAGALAELGDTRATEILVRSYLEDPDGTVRASARRALTQLVGGQAEMAIAVYQDARQNPGQDTEEDEDWLIETGSPESGTDEAAEFQDEELSMTDLEGINRIAMYEGSEKLRLLAIQALSKSSDMRATDTLANLALWGDNRRLRAAARQALTDRYGEQAEEILESYRSAAFEEAASSGRQDELEEDSYLEDEDDETDEDDEEDAADQEDFAEDPDDEEDVDEPVSRPPSPYTMVDSGRSGGPIVEETGVSWQVILLVVIGIAILTAVFLLGRF
jgi:HEAT repeat protein